MTLFLQIPPTGVMPHAIVAESDLAWVYDWEAGWIPVTDEAWQASRRYAGFGAEFIPGVDITGARIADTVGRRLMGERPKDGCFGLWSRCIWHLKAVGGLIDNTVFGLFWHPDPNALEHCQAQARDSGPNIHHAKEPHADLTWRPYASFDELWAAIPSYGPKPTDAQAETPEHSEARLRHP